MWELAISCEKYKTSNSVAANSAENVKLVLQTSVSVILNELKYNTVVCNFKQRNGLFLLF